MTRSPINFAEKLAKFSEYWSPRVVAEMNDYQFKLVKVQGEFVWHTHDDTDETFVVLDGELEIAFRDGSVFLRAGEMYVVSKGLEHITRAARETRRASGSPAPCSARARTSSAGPRTPRTPPFDPRSRAGNSGARRAS